MPQRRVSFPSTSCCFGPHTKTVRSGNHTTLGKTRLRCSFAPHHILCVLFGFLCPCHRGQATLHPSIHKHRWICVTNPVLGLGSPSESQGCSGILPHGRKSGLYPRVQEEKVPVGPGAPASPHTYHTGHTLPRSIQKVCSQDRHVPLCRSVGAVHRGPDRARSLRCFRPPGVSPSQLQGRSGPHNLLPRRPDLWDGARIRAPFSMQVPTHKLVDPEGPDGARGPPGAFLIYTPQKALMLAAACTQSVCEGPAHHPGPLFVSRWSHGIRCWRQAMGLSASDASLWCFGGTLDQSPLATPQAEKPLFTYAHLSGTSLVWAGCVVEHAPLLFSWLFPGDPLVDGVFPRRGRPAFLTAHRGKIQLLDEGRPFLLSHFPWDTTRTGCFPFCVVLDCGGIGFGHLFA